MDLAQLIKKLKDPDIKVRQKAAEALQDAALKGQDISAAIPALADALSDNYIVYEPATTALIFAAKNNIDIENAVPALKSKAKEMVTSPDYESSLDRPEIDDCYEALALHDANKKAWKSGKSPSGITLSDLEDAAKKGEDISKHIPTLINNFYSNIHILAYFSSHKKENAKLVLNEINKSKINKNSLVLKEFIKKLEELMKK